ncbi:unnamed protein product [Ilex paraguariensis]|uniref:Mediator of RNA polymerase II transcription subunit 18 n=1 Tax=Ilex paraguariensis TaxID=185542 RepID=A0ABC8S5B5_9AQUA
MHRSLAPPYIYAITSEFNFITNHLHCLRTKFTSSTMKATTLIYCPTLPATPFSTHPRRRRRQLGLVSTVVNARREANGRDYDGRLVDENMIVLRMRIKEITMMETSHVPPSDWMKWEKQYYEHYDEDVCEAVGLLQFYLMNTRPSLALGMAALVALSVPFSTFVVMLNAVEIAKGLFSLFHFA